MFTTNRLELSMQMLRCFQLTRKTLSFYITRTMQDSSKIPKLCKSSASNQIPSEPQPNPNLNLNPTQTIHSTPPQPFPHPAPAHLLSNLSKQKLQNSPYFKYHKQFKADLCSQIIETNLQSMRLMLHYGNYRMEVSVIYTQVEEGVLEGSSAKGAFGIVRFVEFQGEKFAVKGVRFRLKGDQVDLEDLYKEYFLGCMAFVLEVGPKILPLFGYDIMVGKSMAFFAMQECKLIKLNGIETLQHELAQNLQIIHSIQLVHIDIKPANVVYSRHLKKHVFIDFGLSKIIQQLPTQKTRTKFSGTLSYCSQQMKKCLLSTKNYVDLYENDLCCFNKTIRQLDRTLEADSIHMMIENIREEYEDMEGEKERHRDSENFGIFQEIIEILRLKFCVERECYGDLGQYGSDVCQSHTV